MAAETVGILCPLGQWTTIATGKSQVLIKLRTRGSARVVAQASAPSGEPAVNFVGLSDRTPLSLSFVGSDTNVYLWPNDGDLNVEVIRE